MGTYGPSQLEMNDLEFAIALMMAIIDHDILNVKKREKRVRQLYSPFRSVLE